MKFLTRLLHPLSGRDQNGRPNKAMHPSDLVVVVIAFIITCCFAYLALMPQNWSAIDQAMAPVVVKPKPAVQHPGETEMMLFESKKK